MTNSSLASVTTDLIESYGNTAKNVINVCRVGNQSVAGFINQRWESAVMASGKRLKAEVRSNALAAQKKINGYYLKGIAASTQGADTAVFKTVELAIKAVQRMAANAARFEKATGVTALNTLAVAAVPTVQAISKLATRIEKKSDDLLSTASGTKTAAKAAVTQRVTALRKARPAKAA